MEATATRRDGDPGGPSSFFEESGRPSSSRWTYKHHEQISSAGSYTRSSRSGTIVSTAHTTGASLSTDFDFELKIHGYDEHLSWGERIKEKEKKRVTALVNGGVERWLTMLRVYWVLDLGDDPAPPSWWSWMTWIHQAQSWIPALARIVETIRSTSTLPLPDTGDDEEQAVVPNQFLLLMRVTSKILQRVKSKLVPNKAILTDDRASIITDQIQFARFAQMAMLKMLAFVDVVADVDLWRQLYRSLENLDTYHQLINLLLGVHGALSKALHVINVLFISSPPGEVERILGEIFRLLSTKEEKALDAVWLTLNATTTHVLNRIEDSSATQTLQQGSSDIHKVTLSVISHISFLMDNKLSLEPIVSEADNRGGVYGSRIGDLTHFDSMIIRMASRLEEKLASLSESFPDQGLKFLFLLNNSHQLHQCLRLEPGWSSLQVVSLVNKVDDYMQSYLQVSWAPVLSCLFSPTNFLASILGKNYSPSFESEFQNTYTTQKLWKVPDPELRKTLRTAIMDKLIPSYIKCIEDNIITKPRLAPQELEEMLQDLFEG